jgi:hypothetical protein
MITIAHRFIDGQDINRSAVTSLAIIVILSELITTNDWDDETVSKIALPCAPVLRLGRAAYNEFNGFLKNQALPSLSRFFEGKDR